MSKVGKKEGFPNKKMIGLAVSRKITIELHAITSGLMYRSRGSEYTTPY